ncbi:SdpI family protein [Hyphomonas jannaschiana]|uniref:SdpI family protein n=1 Tax=Hyphomonas jannaschiana TaxID=86 RepID=UPI0035C6EE4A
MKPFIRNGLLITLGATIAGAAISLAATQALPTNGEFPVHWGPTGAPDRWTDRTGAIRYLWTMPAITLGVGLLLAAVPSIDPRKGNIEKGRRGYVAIWLAVMVLLTCIHGGVALQMIRTGEATEGSGQMVRWVIAGASIMFIIVGNYLPKTRSSFFFGIRTPWTLSSDTAWEKTHRLAGPLFMIAGALGLVGAFIFNGILLAVQLTGWAGIAAIISVIYSYFAWRNAPDREHGTNLTV